MVGRDWAYEEDRLMTPLRLLVVADDLASLELMVEVFRSLKAEVHPVRDSEKAVGRTQQNKFVPESPVPPEANGSWPCFPVAHAAPGSTPTPLSVVPSPFRWSFSEFGQRPTDRP